MLSCGLLLLCLVAGCADPLPPSVEIETGDGSSLSSVNINWSRPRNFQPALEDVILIVYYKRLNNQETPLLAVLCNTFTCKTNLGGGGGKHEGSGEYTFKGSPPLTAGYQILFDLGKIQKYELGGTDYTSSEPQLIMVKRGTSGLVYQAVPFDLTKISRSSDKVESQTRLNDLILSEPAIREFFEVKAALDSTEPGNSGGPAGKSTDSIPEGFFQDDK